MVADVIGQGHDESHQTYGARRVHAELVLDREVNVARCTVELIMRRLGLSGLPARVSQDCEHTDNGGSREPRLRPVVNRTGCGSLTSPSIQRRRARSTARWC